MLLKKLPCNVISYYMLKAAEDAKLQTKYFGDGSYVDFSVIEEKQQQLYQERTPMELAVAKRYFDSINDLMKFAGIFLPVHTLIKPIGKTGDRTVNHYPFSAVTYPGKIRAGTIIFEDIAHTENQVEVSIIPGESLKCVGFIPKPIQLLLPKQEDFFISLLQILVTSAAYPKESKERYRKTIKDIIKPMQEEQPYALHPDYYYDDFIAIA